MNESALQLGLTGTSFRNPAGLDHPAHWSTPEDIAWLTVFAMRNSEIADRMARAGATIVSDRGDRLQLYHTHALMHEKNTVMAGKTGTTNDAGQCLVSLVEGKDSEYIVVLLNSNHRYKDMKKILAVLGEPQTPDVTAQAIE